MCHWEQEMHALPLVDGGCKEQPLMEGVLTSDNCC